MNVSMIIKHPLRRTYKEFSVSKKWIIPAFITPVCAWEEQVLD